jgi:hypothetical protein
MTRFRDKSGKETSFCISAIIFALDQFLPQSLTHQGITGGNRPGHSIESRVLVLNFTATADVSRASNPAAQL